jgi:hypothetical protein
MMRLRRLVLLATVSLPFAPRGALAQDAAPPDQRARAQQLFEAAMADVEKENFDAACPKFRASYEADPKASVILNLAQCYERIGKTASAWGAYKEAVVLAKKAQKDEWTKLAEERIAAITPKLITLSIVVPPESVVGGLEIRRDGTPLLRGEWEVAIPIDPGEHAVEASAPGKESWSRLVTALEGDAKLTVSIPVLRDLPKPDVPPPPIAERPVAPPIPFWNTQRTVGLIVGGVGLATMASGLVLGLAASTRYDSARSECNAGTTRCPPDAVARSEGAYDLATASTVTFVAGGLVLVGGGVLFLFANDPKKNWISLSPAAGPSQAGLQARGTW